MLTVKRLVINSQAKIGRIKYILPIYEWLFLVNFRKQFNFEKYFCTVVRVTMNLTVNEPKSRFLRLAGNKSGRNVSHYTHLSHIWNDRSKGKNFRKRAICRQFY